MKKGSEVQKNMISLIFYILNFKMIEIWLSSIEQIPVLDFILSLSVGFCEAVILEITEINSSFIDFLNECSFFKNVKKILIFGGSVSNDFNLNSVHLPNLETLSLFMKNDIIESDKFTKPLKMATEAEIKDSKISPEETPIDNKKEKHSAESDKYSANTSISVFHFMGNKVLLPKNFLTLINVMKNLETLKIEVCDLQFLPIFTDICDVPKKVLKSLIIIVASEFSTMYLYFIRSFLVLESLILKSKVLSKIRYDFSDVPYKEYKFTCIALTGIDILIENVIFLKNLSHLTELIFNNCPFIERSYLSLTKKNFSGLKLLVCNIFFEDSRTFVDYSKDITMFLSTEFSGDVLHVQNVFNHFS
ncbi:hypothetical protein CWI38_1471p0010 [Hamiltosporidium tvaerminnensis]|uniref:Uncharacterized protein n=1 Tax=Hamiltosporidium tvaerminnensis TaxID=1176355 RepID=A0A4Q9LRQ5_9MICR|nr:hypothetical protein CWI38_1471p0010 [Hamiltosporidium tvaerminnensis]